MSLELRNLKSVRACSLSPRERVGVRGKEPLHWPWASKCLLRRSVGISRGILALLFSIFFVSSAHARINVVTLPDRDSVQLTIYNSVDLTLVQETRHLTFRKGLNKLEFSWANTLIDPTSVEFRAVNHADEIE